MKLFLVNRIDFRGCIPIKVFAIKDNAKQFCGECNIAVKLVLNSPDPVSEQSLVFEFDKDFVLCNTKYEVEEIQSE